MLCGHPSCGKSSYGMQLEAYLRAQGCLNVTIVSEESEGISRADGYKDSSSEKKTRGVLKSAVDHKLSAESYIILDSMNYIKGYRYELYCIARTLRTPHCVIWVQCDEAVSTEWNRHRIEQGQDSYTEDILVDLRRRFEQPMEKNRWDCPLFQVNMTPASSPPLIDAAASIATATAASGVAPVLLVEEEATKEASGNGDERAAEAAKTTNFASAWRRAAAAPAAGGEESLVSVVSSASTFRSSSFIKRREEAIEASSLCFSGSLVHVSAKANSEAVAAEESFALVFAALQAVSTLASPNSSTKKMPHGSADLLFELDLASQQIVQAIVAHQADAGEGVPLILADYQRTMALHRHVGLAELQRHKRSFVKANSLHPPSGNRQVLGSMFIDFLATLL